MIPVRATRGYRADRLGAEGLFLVAGAAVRPRAAVAGVGGQQVFQQPGTEPGYRGADRQLHRLQPFASAQRPRCQGGQPLYLGGSVGGERLAEPPLSPAGLAWGSPADGVTGRASQIASFTATTCSESAANCW